MRIISRLKKFSWGHALIELILITVGLFMAIQIDNWKENRMATDRVTSFLYKMSDEIKTDINYLLESDSVYAIYESDSEKAIEKFYRANSVRDIQAAASLFITKWRDLQISRSTYDEMLGTGSFYILKNKTLQDKINSYYNYAEAQQFTIRSINNNSQEISRNPDLNSYRFLINSSDHFNYHKIDTSWIGNVNAPTFLALDQYYRFSQGAVNTYRRRALQGLLNRSYELVEEIENELNK